MMRLVPVFAICCLFYVSSLFAQHENSSKDCTNPTEISISADKILLTTSGDYSGYMSSNYPVVFYQENDIYTFWYKLIVNVDCELTFNILPSNPDDLYNFFMYKHPGGNFCKGINDRSILPVRANLYKNKISISGTGLSKTENALHDSAKIFEKNIMYFTSHHDPVQAEKGSIYYLNIYHTKGEDCGHYLQLNANKQNKTIQAAHKPCYIPPEYEEIPAIPGKISEIITEKEVLMPAKKLPLYYTLNGTITDSRKAIPLNAEVKIIDAETGEQIQVTRLSQPGNYSAKLQSGKKYKQTCSSVGYKEDNSEIIFVSEEAESHLHQVEIKLQSVKAGENIVLDNIYFHPNTYVFRKESFSELERLLNFMSINEDAVIEIQGHTNGDYSIKPDKRFKHLGEDWNFKGPAKKLSKYRSDVVKKYLLKNGIDDKRIATEGFGGSKMLITNPVDYKEMLKNMRVEILILSI